ncbi:ABC transporter ATP-binding protein [Bradyrhizobium sp. LHD-71]|uniref:ABC transporter ATP-binding protein n=1 Tax=Bradyrhizobium sp. LHD-71 TaxID=3072141 RepID=UPI00280EB84B|nr:ABC transporter ATP-binding protein [Bradyrhizobium sp. LHD-71]MDQ8727730.1 ABC transporter ATP-binding protein [Bradyrhizobium sp. LHD-71]
MRIEAQGISVRLGSVDALQGVDFVAEAGEIVGLIGPNGSGKTTLLRTLANLRPSDRGRVRYEGRSAAEVGAAELSRQIAYLAQSGEAHWPMRVEALVALGRLPHRRRFQRSAAADRAAIERAMLATDIVSLRERTMTQISGGERMRVLLARALAVEAPMLLADEPVAALDPLHQLQVMDLLRKKAAAGGGVVVVLHDLALAARFCDRLVLLDGGRVLAAGDPAAVLTDDHLATAFGVEVVRGEHQGAAFVVPWAPSEKLAGFADEQATNDNNKEPRP